MISIGDLVRANVDDHESLVLWEDVANESADSVCEVSKDAILVVLQTKKADWRDPTSLWLDGACLVMEPGGLTGWVGAGWIEPIST